MMKSPCRLQCAVAFIFSIFAVRSSLARFPLGDFFNKASYSAAIVACGRALQLSQVLRLATCGGVSRSWASRDPGMGGI